MRKALTLLIALLCANLALAQKKPLACQVDAAAGLKWENGQWRIARFIERKFILVLEGNTLTKESVAQAQIGQAGYMMSCDTEALNGSITCVDKVGHTLIFNPKNNHGGISTAYSTTDSDVASRDSTSIEAFTCQPY